MSVMEEYNQIFASDLPEIEKLAQAFGLITGTLLEHSEGEIDLLRALNDREALVKEQIKLGMLKHVRDVFDECYRRTTGRRAWDE